VSTIEADTGTGGAALRAVPHRLRRLLDPTFRWVTLVCAAIIVGLVAATCILLFTNALPSIREYGLSFITSAVWDPSSDNTQLGLFTAIWGTLVSTAIALIIAVPLALCIALLLTELVHPTAARIVGTAIEMLAAIPSIIYGMWGFFVLGPIMGQHVEPWISSKLGFIPLFANGGASGGWDLFTGGVILALMILPFITAVSRDVLEMVPSVLKEAGYGMGSTTWEVTRKVSLRYGSAGIVGAIILGLGRAIGETMAVAFVIGSSMSFSWSLFSPGYTISSLIANTFQESTSTLQRAGLIEAGLVLLVMTLIVQVVAQLWLKRVRATTGGRA
jgi:phosphate transport system permease protein